MKTKYKFIHFNKCPDGSQWDYILHNNKTNDILGFIFYYPQWKQSVIEFEEKCVFNNQCLFDITNFLHQLNEAKKAGKI